MCRARSSTSYTTPARASRERSVRLEGGGVRPVRPLIGVAAAAVGGATHNPQVEELLRHRLAVVHLDADHSGVAVDRDQVVGHRERFVGAGPLGIPHLPDRTESDDRLVIGTLSIAGVLGEKLPQRLDTGGTPGLLVRVDPVADLLPIGHSSATFGAT